MMAVTKNRRTRSSHSIRSPRGDYALPTAHCAWTVVVQSEMASMREYDLIADCRLRTDSRERHRARQAYTREHSGYLARKSW